jgi:tRNA A37 threonylcarbamoyltransferase TsaD
MRDAKSFLALVVASGLLLLVAPWWVALVAFVVGYVVLGHITYINVIDVIQEVTGLDYFRANKIYKATLTGNWSEISDHELRVPTPQDPKKAFKYSKLKTQIITLIILERSRRETLKKSTQFYNGIMDEALKDTDPKTIEELRKKGLI